ncbi:hypothetical protein GCM10011506_21610 [Marivirga lumbricoides]|uniref:SPOR domain-containing protein n=1 Tax=Marivirga lumbricoides TaxID=1046115 RepID=A0A2T4DUK4_9BACT|nr:hypothetical protein C9994_02495 [Marivirga lumbricoides]GGC35862.1 hypothetical protein GCM10011506_21610 [Marivirga lumbricoides]
MAKKDKNEDEYKDENFDNSYNQNDEDFGLPDLDDESTSEQNETSYEEPHASDDTDSERLSDVEEPSDSPYLDDTTEPEQSQTYDEIYEEDNHMPAYEPPKKQSVAPIIITLSILVVLAAVLVYFFFFKESEPPKMAKEPVKDTTTYVVEKPVEVEEPEVVEPEEPKIGVVNTLSTRTGRSYVVVGSFFDADMAGDYAEDLANQGMNAYIIPPFGKSKFNRVAIEETASFSDANARASELAGQFKEQPWPLKY